MGKSSDGWVHISKPFWHTAPAAELLTAKLNNALLHTKDSERMSCEHFAIFSPNLAFMSYIRQNESIGFLHISTTKNSFQMAVQSKWSLKLSRNKKDLNDVTAAPFLVFFLLLAAEKSCQFWDNIVYGRPLKKCCRIIGFSWKNFL